MSFYLKRAKLNCARPQRSTKNTKVLVRLFVIAYANPDAFAVDADMLDKPMWAGPRVEVVWLLEPTKGWPRSATPTIDFGEK